MDTVLDFFDCNCSVGFRGKPNPGSITSTAGLIEGMEQYGIKKALVYHSFSREYHPLSGNNRLKPEIEGCGRLMPVWAVMPHHTREFPDPEALLELMSREGVKAVRMFPSPGDHNYSLAAWNCGSLFRKLEESRIPVFIGLDQLSWSDISSLCSDYPGLKLVLTDVNYRADRNLYALMELHDGLFVETSGYKVHNGIEEMCNRFGAGRLVFGSGMPVFSGAAAVSMINYAGITDSEKRMIAYENLETLLMEVVL